MKRTNYSRGSYEITIYDHAREGVVGMRIAFIKPSRIRKAAIQIAPHVIMMVFRSDGEGFVQASVWNGKMEELEWRVPEPELFVMLQTLEILSASPGEGNPSDDQLRGLWGEEE